MKQTFETVAELKAANLTAGNLTRIKGSDSVNDGKDRVLLVQTAAQFGGTPDELNDFVLANTNVARTLKSTTIIDNTEAQIRGANDGYIDLSPRIPKINDGIFDFWLESAGPQTSDGFGSSTMWRNENNGSTKSVERKSLTLGVDIPDIPEAEFYSETTVTSVAGAANFVRVTHQIESVRSYAGQTFTFQVRGRSDATRNIAIEAVQNFGTGGSPSSEVTGIGSQKVELTTTFTRKQVTISVPNIDNKTLGNNNNDYLEIVIWFDAGTDFDARTDSLGQQSGRFDITCAQDDIGTELKPFYVFSKSENLDRVDRHIQRYDKTFNNTRVSNGFNQTTSRADSYFHFRSKLRRNPTVTFNADPAVYDWDTGTGSPVVSNIIASLPNQNGTNIIISTDAVLTVGEGGQLVFLNPSAFLQADARLKP